MTQLTLYPRPYAGASPEPLLRGPGSPPAPPTDAASLDRGRLAQALRRRWWAILLGGVIGAGGAALWASQQSRMYLGTALVQLAPSRENYTEGIADRQSAGGFTQGLAQLETISSRATVGAVVDSEPLGLRVKTRGFSRKLLRDVSVAPDAPEAVVPVGFTPAGVLVNGGGPAVPYGQPVTAGSLRFTVVSRPDPRTLSGHQQTAVVVLARDAAIANVSRELKARARTGSTLIDIVFPSSDPDLARRVVNRTALVFQATTAQSEQQQAHRRRVFIGEQIDRLDGQMSAAERALSSFRSREQAFSAAEKFSEQQKDLLSLQLRERDAQSTLGMTQTVLRAFEANTPAARATASRVLASTNGLSANPIITSALAKLVSYETSRAELTNNGPGAYTSQHPDVLRLDSLIAATHTMLTGALRAQVGVLDAQVRDIASQRAARERELRGLPLANAEETQLLQNDAVLRTQSNVLRGEFQKARIAEAVAVGPVEILQLEAHPAVLPSTDARVIIIAALLGLALGTAAGVAPVLYDRSLRRRVDVEAALRFPVLATVPRLELPATASRRFWHVRLPSRAAKARDSVARRNAITLAPLQVRTQPGAEAYRHLRATLFSTRNGIAPRKLLITSALPAEGKTSVATNLAAVLAQQGRRVLIIDCDLHNAKVHRALGMSVAPGLTDALRGRGSPNDVLRQAVVDGLFVITAGTPDASAADLLGSPRLRAMLNDFAQQFEVVIIDSPPVLVMSDAAVLGAQADAVVMVVRAGQTTAADATEAVGRLAHAGAPIAGAVFNDPDNAAEDESRSGYYYYYQAVGA